MYEIRLCIYRDDETTDEKVDWSIVDSFGLYESKHGAEHVAAHLACLYFEFVELYCATHGCDGISFDVVDLNISYAVTAYELSAAGNVTEWHDEECHEFANGWKVI